MAVTNENSDLMARYVLSPPKLNPKSVSGAALAVEYFTFTQGVAAGDANSTIRICRTKKGYRFNPYNSYIKWTAFGAARVLAFGWEAYTDPDGTAVAASATGLATGLDVSAAGQNSVAASPTTVTHDKIFNGEAVITAQVTGGTIPAGAIVRGVLAFTLGTPGE